MMAIATRNQSHRCSVCRRLKPDCVEQLGARAGIWVCRTCAEKEGQLRLFPADEQQES
jgi:ribosomal protein L37AE/L43A